VNCIQPKRETCTICHASALLTECEFWGDNESAICPRCAKKMDSAPELFEACMLAVERLGKYEKEKDFARFVNNAIKLAEGRQ